MENLVGKEFTANIGLGKPWIQYSVGSDNGDFNEDENYYKDYIDERGVIAYCDGEVCTLVSYDEDTLTLRNKNIDQQDFDDVFTISREQFEKDFTKCIDI